MLCRHLCIFCQDSGCFEYTTLDRAVRFWWSYWEVIDLEFKMCRLDTGVCGGMLIGAILLIVSMVTTYMYCDSICRRTLKR
jgi:hypothetical protein